VAARRQSCLGIDFGGTNTRWGLVTPDGRITARASHKTNSDAAPAAELERLAGALKAFIKEQDADVCAAGMGICGFIDFEKQNLIVSPNMPAWNDVEVARILGGHLGMPCVFDNDLHMSALGESAYGAAKGVRDFAAINLGTGVGGALFLNGGIHRGARGITGEIGHLPLDPQNGPPCGCGRNGCLEAFVGRDGILELYRFLCDDGGTEPKARGQQELCRLASAGDKFALGAYAMAGEYLGRGLAILANLLNPSLLVIGGGVAKTGGPLLDPARKALKLYALPAVMEDLELKLSRLGDDAGILGAAHAARLMRD